MTAIFVVMNRAGLAIAADSAVSAQMTDDQGKSRTVFTEQVSKIYRQERFNFVVASAGASTINQIPIEGILNRWLANCEKKPSLKDYVEAFIRWLAEESCLEEVASNTPYLLEQMERQFRSLKEELQQENSHTVSDTISNLYRYWETVDMPNVYGSSEKKLESRYPNDIAPEVYADFCSRFVDYRLREELHESFLEEMNYAFEKAYQNVLEATGLLGSEEKELLRKECIKFNFDFNDSEKPKAHLMFAGYGESDWIPHLITINLFDFDTLLPRVSIRRIATPESHWYMALAANEAVNKFWNPVDAQFESELRAKLTERFKGRNYLKLVLEVFDQVVSEHANDVVAPIRNKINLLSVDKLGFIARQMVAMESFNSFVFQYLPEVGGHIEVVKITRDEFRDLTDIE